MLFPLKRIAFTCILAICCLLTRAQPLAYNQQAVDSIIKKLPALPDDSQKVESMILLAQMNLQKMDSAQIMYWSNQAKAISEKTGYTKGKILSLGQMAFYHSISGDWPKAILEINEAVSYCKGPLEPYNIFFYSLRVIISNNREDYADAKYWAMKSLRHPAFNQGGALGQWPTYMQLGLIYDKLNMIDSAEYFGNKSREMMKLASFRDLELNTHMVLGNVALKKKNYQEALNYYRQYPELKGGLAEVHYETGHIDSAIFYGKQAMVHIEKFGSSQSMMVTAKLLSQIYEKQDPKESLRYLKISAEARDRLFSTEKLKTLEALTLNEQKMQFESQKQAAASRNRLIQLALGAFAALLLLSALIFYRVSAVRKAHNEKLTKAYSDLEHAQEKLVHAEKMASLGQLTAGIAHEIQNPLNFVNNFSEINTELIEELQENLPDDKTRMALNEVKANMEKITAHGKRADAIVKSMLQHSKVQNSERRLTDINALVSETTQQAKQMLPDKGVGTPIETSIQLDPFIGKMEVAPAEIASVIMNLLTNAQFAVSEKMKLNPAHYQPQIEVATLKSGNEIMITVRDNGIGIPSSALQKIFQPFYTTRATGSGTGLGLSLNYNIIKAHGGEINVMSSEGMETKFTVVLPIA
jgi:two-component system, NtrC family, sensor kinase